MKDLSSIEKIYRYQNKIFSPLNILVMILPVAAFLSTGSVLMTVLVALAVAAIRHLYYEKELIFQLYEAEITEEEYKQYSKTVVKSIWK